MAELKINGRSVNVDGEGFLVEPSDWDRDLAEVMASHAGLTLNDSHWKVIEFCRKDYEATKQAPGLRRIAKQSGVSMKELYKMFPGGPGKLAAKVSGLHKPTSCV